MAPISPILRKIYNRYKECGLDALNDRTVKTPLSGGSDPAITKKPEGAWTHAVSDKAM